MECPYHTQTIHTHVDKEANNKSDALTAPATLPPHCNTLFTHPQPLHPPTAFLPSTDTAASLLPFPKTRNKSSKRLSIYQRQTELPRASNRPNIPKTIKWTNAQRRFRNPLNRNNKKSMNTNKKRRHTDVHTNRTSCENSRNIP